MPRFAMSSFSSQYAHLSDAQLTQFLQGSLTYGARQTAWREWFERADHHLHGVAGANVSSVFTYDDALQEARLAAFLLVPNVPVFPGWEMEPFINGFVWLRVVEAAALAHNGGVIPRAVMRKANDINRLMAMSESVQVIAQNTNLREEQILGYMAFRNMAPLSAGYSDGESLGLCQVS